MPKFNTMRTPLGGNGFPTPRTHEFSLLMGLPSPQIDTSQLPSVLAMSSTNNSSGRPLYEPPTPLTASLFGLGGPPSITRGGSRNSYLSLGMFPTSEKTPHGHGGEEDIDTFINSYSKFMAPEAASPITYHHHSNQYAMPPLLDNIGLNVFENNAHHAAAQAHAAAMNARNQMNTNSSQAPQHLQRMKMDYMSSHNNNTHHHGNGGGHFESYQSGPAEGSSNDYTAQFFADSNASMGKGDHKGRGMKTGVAKAPVPKPTGVTAA
jgi:hypothetical protein